MELQLTAEVRTKRGKGIARKLRSQFRVPGICYCPHISPLMVSVSVNELERLIRQIGDKVKIFPLIVERDGEKETRHVMIRDIQVHPVKPKILHVDFYEVSMDQPITIDVPIELTGEPIGVKKGGILEQVRHSVSVRCLPTEIPEQILVDVSSLDIGESFHIGDLKKRIDLELVEEDQITLATIAAPTVELEAAAEEEQEGVESEGEEVTE